jgi:copper resistance protein D
MSALLAVFLRGIGTAGAALALGGVAYAVVVLQSWRCRQGARVLKLVAWGAGIAAGTQIASLALTLATLADARGWPLGRAVDTGWFLAGAGRAVALAVTALLAVVVRRQVHPAVMPASRASRLPSDVKVFQTPMAWTAVVVAAVASTASAAAITHAAARVDARAWAVALDAIHQVAVAVWVGGLAHLLVAWPPRVDELRRFSSLALVAVTILGAAGVGLALVHVGSVDALGTAYGAMVVTKVVVFAGLVGIAAVNRAAVRRLPMDARPSSSAPGAPAAAGASAGAAGASALAVRLRRFVEVEVGVAVTLLFVGASLSSAPPAADVVADRASLAEVVARVTPGWPQLTTPSFAELAQPAPGGGENPLRTEADARWSEFNHNVAGLFVLGMGMLALLERTGRARWARGWPLLFIGLSAFIVTRSDPGHWPFGAVGFLDSVTDAEVIQHWLLGLLPAAFGIVEWLQRTGRLAPRPWAYIFPLLSAVGGGLLLSHAHTLVDVKESFLTELTHLPLGVLALVVGWSRWLELRLPPPDHRAAGRLWAPALMLVGALLLLYRER